MLKIKKIEDKEILEVLAQDNCAAPHQNVVYQKGQDCQNDCHKQGQAPSYQSTWT